MLQNLIVGLFVAGMLYLLQKTALKPGKIDRANGTVYLRHSLLIKMLFWICASIVLFVLALLMLNLPSNEQAPMWGLVVLFGLGGIYLGKEVYYTKICFDKTGVHRRMHAKITSISWLEIEKAQFSAFHGALVLTSINGERIKISIYQSGFNQLVDAIELQTSFKRDDMRLPQ